MSSGRGVVVVGSANMDLVLTVERIPEPGETLLAKSLGTYPGGKGLNQAVAAARSGADCSMIGAVGNDDYSTELIRVMKAASIRDSQVRRVSGPAGLALITVGENAENTIVVASGANATLTELNDSERNVVAGGSVVLAQLELPLGAVIQAAGIAREAGARFILNAAPAARLPEELINNVDVLIVNEHEACVIAGLDDLAAASAALAEKVPTLIVTLGAAGSAVYQGGVSEPIIPALKVVAVDTTGAGDTYCGAFAAAISMGESIRASISFATAAAALSVQKRGAVPSIPERLQTEELLAESQ